MRSPLKYALLIANAYATCSAILLSWRPAFLWPALGGSFFLQAAYLVASLAGLATGVALVIYYAALVLRSDRSRASRVAWLGALFLAAPVGTLAAWFVFAHRERGGAGPSATLRIVLIGVVALMAAVLLVVLAPGPPPWSGRGGGDAGVQEKLAWLSSEAASVAHPADAVPVSTQGGASRLRRSGAAARVETTYRSALGRDDVRHFYDSELGRRGWRVASEKPLLDHGVPSGDATTYCRDGYAAYLQYSPSDAWTFALSLSWRLHPECD